MDKYNKIAREIIALIGEDNIISVTHCATRIKSYGQRQRPY